LLILNQFRLFLANVIKHIINVLNYLMFSFAAENQLGLSVAKVADKKVRQLTTVVIQWLSWLVRHRIQWCRTFNPVDFKVLGHKQEKVYRTAV